MKPILALILIFMLVAAIRGMLEPEPFYEDTWQDDGNIIVARALTTAQVRGCGFFVYKQRSDSKSTFHVRCGFDDEIQTYYKVWAASKEVWGPFFSEEQTPK